ncbi:hypothetical protein E4T56_gene12231 [Termitomyces sp. T112]|nr:hypothetical protein E4T56_gene12231 [Termitomyces sp. T112]KNZ78006.1 hypothetical protein J132_02649 [Termitomyces sp. J132]
MDSLDNRNSEEEYQLLATGSPSSYPSHVQRRRRSRVQGCLRHHTLRRILGFVVLIPIFLLLGVLWSGVPPSFEDIREFERNLPQHYVTQVHAKGGKYIRFPDHLWGHGFNNVLQEALLLHYVAEKSDRSYVFEDYVWSHLPFRYTLYDFALRPVRLPMNAFISGPTAGSLGPHSAAVNVEFWDMVCPPHMRRVISSKDSPSDAEGNEIVDWWVERLKVVQDDCLEIDSKEKVIFDRAFFDSDRIISLWPDFSSSPIITRYLWSPLVYSALLRNFPILQPESIPALYDFSTNTTLTGLVALHLRRGDYKRHCPRLAGWKSQYNGLNRLSDLPDKFDSSPYTYESDEYNDYYMQHCLPTVEQLVTRLSEIRKENQELKRVYVLTNAWGFWLNGLKEALLKDGWQDLKSTLDLFLDPKQAQVAAAVDMAIAERSQVFIGNGFSSLTSNIIMLRMVKGLKVSSNRFL